MSGPQKRARTSSPAPAPSPPLPPRILTIHSLARLPTEASHNLILALYARDPTTAELIFSHLEAESTKRREAPPLDFLEVLDPIFASLHENYEVKPYKVDYWTIASDIDEAIKAAMKEMKIGCRMSDRYETRLAAVSGLVEIADSFVFCDDPRLRQELMPYAEALEQGILEFWDWVEQEDEADRMIKDEEGVLEKVRLLRETCYGARDEYDMLFAELEDRMAESRQIAEDE